jgi:hypothetical protein
MHWHGSALEEVSRGRMGDLRTRYRSAAEMQNNTQRALIACSLWLHIGFIGAATLAAGLLQLFDGEGKWLSALALAFSGGVVAAASWRRARTVLEHADRSSAVSVHP